MVFASADFSCFFVQIFFYAHVIGAKREYVALFFFVGQCFQLFGIGKTRNGIGHRFTVFLQFAKFEIYFFLFGRCSRGCNFLLVVVFAKSGFRNFGKLSDDAIFVLRCSFFASCAYISTLRPKGKTRGKTRQNAVLFVLFFANLSRTFPHLH